MPFQRTIWAATKAVALVAILAVAATRSDTALAEKYGKQTCGGIVGKACPAAMFCENPAGMCHGADIQGTCVKVPKICNKIFMPVCGCDGKTYGNDCDREAAKVSKDHDGECKKS